MATLSRDQRRLLENTVAEARGIAVAGAEQALRHIGVHEPEPPRDPKALWQQLRAHGRQLGDRREANRSQQIKHLSQACAYEHWHRMLFARFLAENDLLLDIDHGMAMTLDEVRELAREQNRDWLDLAAELAQRMLLEVFRPDDPVLKVSLPPEKRQQLEKKLSDLPSEIFIADDSLGWVYQFWQRDEKKRINKSEIDIGADQLPAVTQLFTEDYMVLFLLENTLGAWWTAKRSVEGKDRKLPGYTWQYLRLNDDGSPVAGGFDGWPRAARDLRVLDPCMGSGHFLVFALPILARMRMEEEGLSLQEALMAVLRDNLFGLEIDARCAQIAAFNLALAAWRLAGKHFRFPQLNLACSGLGINASESDWAKLSEDEFAADQWMRRLYSLFKDAPTLGSLIDPTRYLETGHEVGFARVLPLIEEAFRREQSEETRELAIAAQGVLAAFRILADRFTLVVTNVPYLGRGKQDETLAEYCADVHSDAKADLATCFVNRCLRFCSDGGSAALVTPQNWLFLSTYRKLRQALLRQVKWEFAIRLGQNAFQDMNWWAATTALVIMTARNPTQRSQVCGLDVSSDKDREAKRTLLRGESVGGRFARIVTAFQKDFLPDKDARIVFRDMDAAPLLSSCSSSNTGVQTGDNDRYSFLFWELPAVGGTGWEFFHRTSEETSLFSGRIRILRWENGVGCLSTEPGFRLNQGLNCSGKSGVLVHRMNNLPATLYSGQIFDQNGAAIIPKNMNDLPAIWCFLSSECYRQEVRHLDSKTGVTPNTLVQVPFDLEKWQNVASEQYPNGLPRPHSNNPTQWLFNGHPRDSEHPLQVAVARIVGYRWPRQTGFAFPDCPAFGPDSLEKHEDGDGIVCLNSLAGEASAADRLRAYLADAYGDEWSAFKLQALLGDSGSLEEWLLDRFFEEHCRVFHQRPFVWHVWDGRKDGFHALVNYHRLAGSTGEGRKTLEKLIYTMLGDWIKRQRDEVKDGKEGADARLAAAVHLQTELEKILKGEKPYDIFVRWKPLDEQAIGWEPDINDGVRPNIRPWLIAKPYEPSRKDACILRVTPRIPYGKDRGKEPLRPKEDYPWFWTWDELAEDFQGGNDFDGVRWNELHYSLKAKQQARKNSQVSKSESSNA